MRLKNRAIRLGCLALAILMVCLAPTGYNYPAETTGGITAGTVGTMKLGTIPSSEVEHSDLFLKLQREAAQNERGLWRQEADHITT